MVMPPLFVPGETMDHGLAVLEVMWPFSSLRMPSQKPETTSRVHIWVLTLPMAFKIMARTTISSMEETTR